MAQRPEGAARTIETLATLVTRKRFPDSSFRWELPADEESKWDLDQLLTPTFDSTDGENGGHSRLRSEFFTGERSNVRLVTSPSVGVAIGPDLDEALSRPIFTSPRNSGDSILHPSHVRQRSNYAK